jgi:hypothetical protein
VAGALTGIALRAFNNHFNIILYYKKVYILNIYKSTWRPGTMT